VTSAGREAQAAVPPRHDDHTDLDLVAALRHIREHARLYYPRHGEDLDHDLLLALGEIMGRAERAIARFEARRRRE
jgi:hypothetical protein